MSTAANSSKRKNTAVTEHTTPKPNWPPVLKVKGVRVSWTEWQPVADAPEQDPHDMVWLPPAYEVE